MIGNEAFKSTIIERIRFEAFSDQDNLTYSCWMKHLSSYIEGTQKGYMKIKGLLGYKMAIESKTADWISMIHYNEKRALLFAGSGDGKFQIWKLPEEWRDPHIDQLEEDYLVKVKTQNRVQRKSQLSK